MNSDPLAPRGVTAIRSQLKRIREGPLLLDVAIAAFAGIIDIVLFTGLFASDQVRAEQGNSASSALVLAFALPSAVLLIWRRRSPLLICSIICALTVASVVLVGSHPIVGVLVAVYTVVAWRTGLEPLLALLMGLVVAGVEISDDVSRAEPGQAASLMLGETVVYLLLLGGVTALGIWVHSARLRRSELVRQRDQAAELAVLEERARLRRELHDIISSSLTAIHLQAAGASQHATMPSAFLIRKLNLIEKVGYQAIRELNRLLSVLDDANVASEPKVLKDNQPGLADLPSLITSTKQMNVNVDVAAEGRPVQLDPSIDVTAYRIIQEALTNTIRHAGSGARASVIIRWEHHLVVVQVRDDGNGTLNPQMSSLSTGHGLLGLTERVAIVGGKIQTGPTEDGGYCVRATLPTAGTSTKLSAGVDRMHSLPQGTL